MTVAGRLRVRRMALWQTTRPVPVRVRRPGLTGRTVAPSRAAPARVGEPAHGFHPSGPPAVPDPVLREGVRMSSTMTALYGGTGPEWELREVPVPTPGPGQVLVRARAAALNHADAAVLAAADPTAGGTGVPYLAGYEFAGEVVALGEGAAGPGVGTRVMGTTPGSFAQYVLVDHRYAVPIPGGLGYEEAAALPTGLLTEHGALMSGGFEAGQSVLITGATSSVGLIGVQAAKALGASTVVATTRTAARGALLREIGADEVVATAEQNLTEAVLELTRGEGVDLGPVRWVGCADQGWGLLFAGTKGAAWRAMQPKQRQG